MLALIKVACAFVFVLLLIRKKCPIGIALLAGGIITAFLFGCGVAETGGKLWIIWSQKETGEFVLLIAFVLAISLTMEVSGQIGRITLNLRGFVKSTRFSAAALPSIVGLLPMPGGALFSAPMVEETTRNIEIEAEDKIGMNYWFRHIWEYSWPLFPGLIYTSQFVLNKSTKFLSVVQLPLTLIAVVAGAIFFLRKIPSAVALNNTNNTLAKNRHKAFFRFVVEMSPFLIIIILHVAAGASLLLALGISICYTVVWNLIKKNIRISELLRKIFVNKHYLGFLIMGYGVKTFGEMLKLSGA
ncbi:MAG: DUF401 family protein, partial [Planctomycetota bacterium]